MYIPDPLEIMESRIERLEEEYIDEHTCMSCGKKVDYELFCINPCIMNGLQLHVVRLAVCPYCHEKSLNLVFNDGFKAFQCEKCLKVFVDA